MIERIRPYDWEIDGIQAPPYNWQNEQVAEPLPEVTSKRRSPAGQRILAVGVCSVLGFNTGSALLAAYKDHRDAQAAEAPCSDPVPQRDIQAVQDLLATPSHFVYKNPDPADYHLTMHSSTAAVRDLDSIKADSPARFASLLRKANSFTEEYGIRISVATNNEAEAEADVAAIGRPSADVLASKSAKANVENIVKGIMDLPVEYVRLSGATRVVLYYPNDRRGEQTGAYTHQGNTVYYNLAYTEPVDTMPHELYHLVDYRECGVENIRTDPEFTALNPGNIYTPDRKGFVSIEDDRWINKYQKLVEVAGTGAIKKSMKFACRLKAQADQLGRQAVVTTDYSFKDAAEDKAELGSAFADELSLAGNLIVDKPVIRKKFIFLLARLYKRQPNYVRYLAAESNKFYHTDFPEVSCRTS